MYMERGGPEVVGLYYDTADWKPIILGGKWSEDNNFEVTTRLPEPDAVAIGALNGRIISSGTLVGTLIMRAGNDGGQEPVAMKRMLQPSCNGSGVWQKFNNPNVPITFSYPASWHVEIAEPDIPNPRGYKASC